LDFGGITLSNSGDFTRYIAKFSQLTDDYSGCLWAKDISYPVISSCIDKETGDIYLSGNYQYPILADTFSLPADVGYPFDGYIARYNTNGSCQWLRKTGDRGGSLIGVNKLGSVIIAGELTTVSTFGTGSDSVTLNQSNTFQNFFVAQYDSLGDFGWAKGLYGDSLTYGSVGITALDIDTNNNVLITGWLNGLVDVGNGISGAIGQSSTYILKYDEGGNYQWLKGVNSEGVGNDFYDIFISSQNEIYLTGMMSDTIYLDTIPTISNIPGRNNMFLCKYKNNGDFSWVQHAETIDNGQSYSEGISVTERNGMVWVAGNFSGYEGFGDSVFFTPEGGPVDIFVVKIRDQEIIPIGVTELSSEDSNYLSVYPNPASTHLNVLFQSLKAESIKLSVYNMLGEKIRDVDTRSNIDLIIDINNFSKGLYLIEVITTETRKVRKVIVQ
jgi:hypothetical protein